MTYNLADTLKRLREKKGVTQKDVALYLSVSNKTVSKWEKGASEPDLSMLVALSEYFGVTADTLLGLTEEKQQSTEEALSQALRGLSREEAILKAFDIARYAAPATHGAIPQGRETTAVYPKTYTQFFKTRIARPDLFAFSASHAEANVSVTLLSNEANFSWLKDAQKQNQMASLFSFLSDTDALSLLYHIHTSAISESFTASYASEKMNLPLSKTERLLDALCEIGICHAAPAHLKEGEIKVYECRGDGVILSILTLAYERMCEKGAYEHSYNASCKMIGAE